MDVVTAARTLADVFEAGGSLLVHGFGAAAPDAEHVSVEFRHPVITGCRALPSMAVRRADDLAVLARPGDAVVLLGEDPGAPEVRTPAGATVIRLAEDARDALVADYHVLWELTHLYLNGRAAASTDAATSFLYGSADEVDLDAAATAAVRQKTAERLALCETVLAEAAGTLAAAAAAVRTTAERGGRVFTFGNGGSATDAAALAAALRRAGVAALALADEPAVVTALANDVAFEVVFARQLASLCGPGDVAVALTTSGGSPNVLAALEQARKSGMTTVAFAGYGGGRLAELGLADHLVAVPASSVHRIQETQTAAYEELVRLAAAAG